MLPLTVSALLLASLATCSPIDRDRTAAILSFDSTSSSDSLLVARDPKVFNAPLWQAEKNQIAAQYSTKTGGAEDQAKNEKVSGRTGRFSSLAPQHFIEEFDVRKQPVCKDGRGKKCPHGKPGKSGHRQHGPAKKDAKEPMIDVFDTIDELYYGKLSVGTPGQVTSVQFDTGSSDLVVPTIACKNCTAPLFNPKKSKTFKSSKNPFEIHYEDKSGATGMISHDTVTVAGLTVKKQGFGCAFNRLPLNVGSPAFCARAINKVTNGFGDGPNSGLIGLGFPANAASKELPFFMNLVKQKALKSNIFSMYMSRSGKEGSELCIGCVDSAKFSGKIEYYPLNPKATKNIQYYWNIKSGGFSYNGKKPATGPLEAVIDSGTSLIYVSVAAAKALYAQIPNSAPAPKEVGDGFFTFPCNATLAPISLQFGSKQYAMDSRDFNLGQATTGSDLCVGGIIGQDTGDHLAIIGDEFMKSWYSVFDYSKCRVGFAKAK
ncbi:hypothetical protein FRB98_006546 [Tulasnella sp. 332]|nr:hypothetical protein FRB98_006546 [Tulasnella sp. 332]